MATLKPYDISTEEKREEFLVSYMPYVESIAKSVVRKFHCSQDIGDLISCGYNGLLEASNNFDPTKNVTFQYYSYLRIYGNMVDYLRKLYAGTNTTVALKKKINELNDINKSMHNGEDITTEDLADALNMPVNKLQKLQNKINNTTYVMTFSEMANTQPDENHNNIANTFADTSKALSEDDVILVEQLWGRMEKAFSDKELGIMKSIYLEDKTYPEISDTLNISAKRISQIHLKCLKRLHKIVSPPKPTRNTQLCAS